MESSSAGPPADDPSTADREPPTLLPDPVVSEVQTPSTRDYDPRPQQERTRTVLAGCSLLLLALTITGILLPVSVGTRTWEEMEGPTAAVLPAVLGIVGTCLAYYFAKDKG